MLTKKNTLMIFITVVGLGLLFLALAQRFNDKQATPEPDLAEQYLDRLIGKPAPELRKIKAWKNSGPMTLAELRGKYVLLDFWGYWCGPCVRDMPHLMAIYDAFSDRGLMVIGIHDDSVASVSEMDEKLAAVREKIWIGRDVQFPIALDGGGQTRIEGTNETVRGATTAAYGITSFPTTVLISPDGKIIERFHAPSLDDKIAALEDLLGVKAKESKWRVPFDSVYQLPKGQVLRNIAEPYIPERSDFFFHQFSRWGWLQAIPTKYMPLPIPESAILSWDEQKNRADGGMDHGHITLIDLLRGLGFYERQFHSDPTLLQRRVPGDWIKRQDVKREELLAALEKILNSELKLPIRFTPAQVQRAVFVARGNLELHTLRAEDGDYTIHLYSAKPDPLDNISGGGGTGNLDNFLNYVGDLGRIWVINETKAGSVEQLTWRQHSSARRKLLENDPAVFELLLKNITRQTSLQFEKESRTENVWLIESTN